MVAGGKIGFPLQYAFADLLQEKNISPQELSPDPKHINSPRNCSCCLAAAASTRRSSQCPLLVV